MAHVVLRAAVILVDASQFYYEFLHNFRFFLFFLALLNGIILF